MAFHIRWTLRNLELFSSLVTANNYEQKVMIIKHWMILLFRKYYVNIREVICIGRAAINLNERSRRMWRMEFAGKKKINEETRKWHLQFHNGFSFEYSFVSLILLNWKCDEFWCFSIITILVIDDEQKVKNKTKKKTKNN